MMPRFTHPPECPKCKGNERFYRTQHALLDEGGIAKRIFCQCGGLLEIFPLPETKPNTWRQRQLRAQKRGRKFPFIDQ